MHKYFLLLIFEFATHICWGQQQVLSAKHMHQLDTILYLKSVCRSDSQLKGFTYTYSNEGELFLNYYNAKIHADTFRIFRVQPKTYHIDSFDICLKKGHKLFKDGILGFALNKQEVAILLTDKIILVENSNTPLKKISRTYKFKDALGYQKIFFTQSKQLLLCRSYNYKRATDTTPKTKFTLVQTETLKETRSISPHVSILALTHMSPVNHVSYNSNLLMVGQTQQYQASIYDYNLNEINKIQNKDKCVGKNTFDTTEVNKVDKLAGNNVSALIMYLQPKFRTGYAFVDGYFLLNPQTLLVRYTPGNPSGDTLYRYFDIWRYNQVSHGFEISDTSYEMRIPSREPSINAYELWSKENYLINFWLHPSWITSEYTYVFSKGTDVYPIGKTRATCKQEEKAYYQNHDPIFTISILKNKF